MKHVRVATYAIKKGSFQEIADVAEKGMLRTFQEQPGFIRYGLADPWERDLPIAQPVGDTQGRRILDYLAGAGFLDVG